MSELPQVFGAVRVGLGPDLISVRSCPSANGLRAWHRRGTTGKQVGNQVRQIGYVD
jgi:hypothetical protein